MTYRSSKSVHVCGLGASRRIMQKKNLKKGISKKPQHVFFHVFAQTTHVVAAPHGFACVGIPATRLYIPSFIEIRSRVSEPQGVKICPFPLLWLVAFTTACTTVQAVMLRRHLWRPSYHALTLAGSFSSHPAVIYIIHYPWNATDDEKRS